MDAGGILIFALFGLLAVSAISSSRKKKNGEEEPKDDRWSVN